jgi:hypothetical protein
MNSEMPAGNEQFGEMAALTPLTMQCEMKVCRPQASAWKPPPRQAVKTLEASKLGRAHFEYI